jgi:hypothetical protein
LRDRSGAIEALEDDGRVAAGDVGRVAVGIGGESTHQRTTIKTN